jgi:hypothetical protein
VLSGTETNEIFFSLSGNMKDPFLKLHSITVFCSCLGKSIYENCGAKVKNSVLGISNDSKYPLITTLLFAELSVEGTIIFVTLERTSFLVKIISTEFTPLTYVFP